MKHIKYWWNDNLFSPSSHGKIFFQVIVDMLSFQKMSKDCAILKIQFKYKISCLLQSEFDRLLFTRNKLRRAYHEKIGNFFFNFVETIATGIVLSCDNCNLCLYSLCFSSPGFFYLRKLSRFFQLYFCIKNKWLGTSFRSPFGTDSTKEGENNWNPLLYLTT